MKPGRGPVGEMGQMKEGERGREVVFQGQAGQQRRRRKGKRKQRLVKL